MASDLAGLDILELFHGPTAAFKDFGARFLAANFARLHEPGSQPVTILVATSGDTGGAVAAAEAQVIGDMRSKNYFPSDCPAKEDVAVISRVVFKNKQVAEQNGYKLAKDCQ